MRITSKMSLLSFRRSGTPGYESWKFQVGAIDEVRQRRQPIEIDRPATQIDVVVGEPEFRDQRARDFRRCIDREFEAHFIAEPARRQFALERAQQVIHFFFVDEQIAVARDAKLITARYPHAWKQIADVGVDDRRQEHEIVRRLRDRCGQTHQSRQRARRLDHRFAARAPERVLAFERHDEAQTFIQHLRKRMRGVEPHGTQDRHQVVREVMPQPLALFCIPAIARDEADALEIEARQQHLVQHAVLLVEQFVRDLRDRAQLFARRHVVGTALCHAECLLVDQSGDADFEELVEVRVGDAQERQPFEQRHVVILRHFEHAPIEFELRQLAVDVQLGALQVQRLWRGLWCVGCVHRAAVRAGLGAARKLIMVGPDDHEMTDA